MFLIAKGANGVVWLLAEQSLNNRTFDIGATPF